MHNGMVVLGQPMEHVQTVAFQIMLPAGAARLPEGLCGAANVMADWIFRGAGNRDSRQLGDALDSLGLHRHASVDSAHLTLGAVMEAGKLLEALPLYADVILRPWLDQQEFELTRQSAIDDVNALLDDPQERVLLELKERFYPHPLGRSTAGRLEQLQAISHQQLADLVDRYLGTGQAIFTVAGHYDWQAICRSLEELFGQDTRGGPDPVAIGQRGPRYTHIDQDSVQIHIGLMTPTVGPSDPDYYPARVAVSILSGGMSARLFTQVREKHGLCYAVSASYHCLKEAAGVICYAGTTPEKAQQAVDLIKEEFQNLATGLCQEELSRAKAVLKSALILNSESSTRRAAAIGADYYLLGRIRDLDQIKQAIDAVTAEDLIAFLQRHPFTDFTMVTIGPRPIEPT